MSKPDFQTTLISQVQNETTLLEFVARYNTTEECVNACMRGYKERSFVYLLTADFEGTECCIYVGKTKSQYTRFLSHIKRFDFDYIYLFECDQKYMLESESLIIKKFKPLYNKKDNPLALRYSQIFNIDYCGFQTFERIEGYLRMKREYENVGLFGFSLNPVIYSVLEKKSIERCCNCSETLQLILEEIFKDEIATELQNPQEHIQTNLTTTIKYAKNHGCSRESIKQFLKEKNRISGAVRIGRDWVLPKDAYFPEDRRKKYLDKND